ncbi:Hypoxia-inducible factor 1-alpha inhibitor (Hypoxia-inducible factor asparagine hydroxylase) [Durusdinium trenchii]|uniref:Hypoxia-inducible factor 1-alpha inhibitor (Hypoxia-inducible factor asparagine hydroxylase) n=1 Tax=Durusdinium trenchii TaxID=1381693 RepID=A0ABP0M271_9DINO
MGGFDAQICAACGQRDAPARCSRCSTWFCGPECQRKAWPTHKLLCTKAVPGPPGSAEGPKTRSSAFEWGADSERLLWSVEKVEELDVDPQRVLRELKPGATQSDLLDALGTALGSSSQQPEVKKAAELLWQRCGWEPHARERHDYSLLHAIPNTSPTTHDWQVTRAPPAPEEAKQRPPSGSRHEPLLLGGSCPIIDAKGGFSSEVKSQLAEFLNPRAPRPCIIKNLPIFDRAVEKWSVDYLKEHMGDQLYHTFASTQEDRRFAYSFDCRNEGGYRPARIAEACKMTFKDFVKQQQCEDGKAYYLQTPVLRYEDGIVTSAKFDEQLEADLHTMNRRLVNEMAQMGSFGELSRNQLFVSFKDFLTASHYDQQHNLYLQLRGSKKFLLFDVTCAPALYTYPVHHSLDRKARVDLESLDPNQLEQWPRAKALAGRGIEAVLSQGDVLFLPMSWFHHVHSLGEENVSLNYWFYDSGKLFEPSKVQWPLSMISLLELSRHVEYLVAEQLLCCDSVLEFVGIPLALA